MTEDIVIVAWFKVSIGMGEFLLFEENDLAERPEGVGGSGVTCKGAAGGG